jgi:hypothetical protein
VEQPHIEALREALAVAGVPAAGSGTAEAIRIEAGVPKFNLDMDADTIPLEAESRRGRSACRKGATSDRKSSSACSIVVTAASPGSSSAHAGRHGCAGISCRGHRREPGDWTRHQQHDLPALGRPIALAYLHRDFLAPGTSVAVGGQTAVVTALPFVP